MWKKSDPSPVEPEKPSAAAPQPTRPVELGKTSPCAAIGPTITIQGEVTGDEDLVIQGRIEGRVDLGQHKVTVGRSGWVRADIHGGAVVVEGEVEGSLTAGELVVVRSSGRVRGDITAPRVTLEDGAGFKGSIDMEGGEGDPSSHAAMPGSERSDFPDLPQDLGEEGDFVIGRILA
ncbi:MAG: polymer-forming cytoskeletal protein [Deltaproteobacteria bacterium]|nr:polymer-forming cytoskeletal protein [Deltaproteobacteria bacterium]